MPDELLLHHTSHGVFLDHVLDVSRMVVERGAVPDSVVGVGRGGLVPAVYLSHGSRVPMLSVDHSSKEPGFAEELLAKVAAETAAGSRVLFVDDINDSGGIIRHIQRILVANGSGSSSRS